MLRADDMALVLVTAASRRTQADDLSALAGRAQTNANHPEIRQPRRHAVPSSLGHICRGVYLSEFSNRSQTV